MGLSQTAGDNTVGVSPPKQAIMKFLAALLLIASAASAVQVAVDSEDV